MSELILKHNYQNEPFPVVELVEKPEKPVYIAGLDLGQAQDYTALAIVERFGDKPENYDFHCRHLQRWTLRTPYPAIVLDTVKIMNSPEMQRGEGRPVLAVDATGVGAPVLDLFKREKMHASLKPIQITGGNEVTQENGVYRVPKRDLVSTVQVLLQNGRFKIAASLPEASTLRRELENFQVKINNNAHDTYGAWREGTHDDLVLAAALCLWYPKGSGLGIF